MARFKAPRGVPDLVPPDSELLSEIQIRGRTLFDSCGYRRIELPVFESTDVFQRAVGEASDIVLSKQMYVFEDRRGRSFALRPEGTAGAARAFIENELGKTMPVPVRLWNGGPMFRYERPQKGRTRQFWQLSIECYGSDSPVLDAEVISIGAEFFASLGMSPELLLNSIGCLADRAAYAPALREALEPLAGDLCEECRERLRVNPQRVFDCKVESCREIIRAKAPPVADSLCDDCRAHFAKVRVLLDSLGVAYEITPDLVRGLDYYTRTIFEFVEPSIGARSSVCGGGRYDGLIEELGGPPTPAVGFSIGVEPTMVVLRGSREDTWRPDAYVIWLEGQVETALTAARRMRATGRRVVVSEEARSMRAQLRAADRLRATVAIIIGPDEAAKGVATVRDLSSGQQSEVPLEDL